MMKLMQQMLRGEKPSISDIMFIQKTIQSSNDIYTPVVDLSVQLTQQAAAAGVRELMMKQINKLNYKILIIGIMIVGAW